MFPSCSHAGNSLGKRRFCRHAQKPQAVTPEDCSVCPFSDVSPGLKGSPCYKRGSQIGSLYCSCPQVNAQGVYECSEFGSCVLKADERAEKGWKSCGACKSREEAPRVKADLSELAIIAVHFNPERYNLPVRNYFEWRNHLGKLQENLITLELSFDDHFTIHDSIRIKGNDSHIMWQKEALINEGIRRLPAHVKYVAWVDHDLIFQNESWAEEAIEKLSNGCDVVQLFEAVKYVHGDGSFHELRPGAVYNWQSQNKTNWGQPGGAWAGRRGYLESIGGLVCNNIIGGADQACCDAWLGKETTYWSRNPQGLVEDNRIWFKRASEFIRQAGYVRGVAHHLYHGTRENRSYLERIEILTKNNFNPVEDIEIDANGLLKWSSDKPALHKSVRDYFSSRKEDE